MEQTNIALINILSASGLRAADWNGKSDPYCICEIADTKTSFKTKVIKKTLNPTWNESFKVDLQDAPLSLKFTLMDWDRFQSDDLLGVAELSSARLVDGKFEGNLEVRFKDPLCSVSRDAGQLFVSVVIGGEKCNSSGGYAASALGSKYPEAVIDEPNPELGEDAAAVPTSSHPASNNAITNATSIWMYGNYVLVDNFDQPVFWGKRQEMGYEYHQKEFESLALMLDWCAANDVHWGWKEGDGGYGQLFYRKTDTQINPLLGNVKAKAAGCGDARSSNPVGAQRLAFVRKDILENHASWSQTPARETFLASDTKDPSNTGSSTSGEGCDLNLQVDIKAESNESNESNELQV